MPAQIKSFYDQLTGTVTHVVYDYPGGRAAIIDPLLDFDPVAGRTSHASARKILEFLQEMALTADWVLETHAHADHLTAAAWLRKKTDCRIGTGKHICAVQKTMREMFNLGSNLAIDGSQFDHLFEDGEVFHIGSMEMVAHSVPGHTPADMAYQIGDALFTGDILLMPDRGTARCDFPGSNASELYQSIHRLLALPEETSLYLCHDNPPVTRAPMWKTTVGEQRRSNIHVNQQIDEQTFIALRKECDAQLALPPLICAALQVNIRAGELPPAESNGVRYLKIPLNVL
jgi:glyoxylase-like metal-dependent hydrolase (beta-lactamase superfamily II)